jgi:hypothetical protein
VMLLTSHRVMRRGRNFEWITSCKSSSLLLRHLLLLSTIHTHQTPPHVHKLMHNVTVPTSIVCTPGYSNTDRLVEPRCLF